MKVRPSVKPMCKKCKLLKRKGRVMVICDNPRYFFYVMIGSEKLTHSMIRAAICGSVYRAQLR